MVCTTPQPYYIPASRRGLKLANSKGDGYTVALHWHEAFKTEEDFNLAYNIYFSSERDQVLLDGPKYLSTNLTGLVALIADFSPGDTYYFAIRATQYDPTWYNVDLLPANTDGYDSAGLKIYPETLLLNNISDTDMLVPIADIDLFPSFGIVQVGVELIRYDSKDVPDNTLIVSERGWLGTKIRPHDVDGYDGYHTWNPIIKFYPGYEDFNKFIIQEEVAINPQHEHFTLMDGYKNLDDIITDSGEKEIVEQNNIDFPPYDFSGWHRTDPALLLTGKCIDSYIGGEFGCADDGYHMGSQIRNISIQDQNTQRQEVLLEQTGRVAVLFRRMWNGIVCSCVQANKETPESRCSQCYGTGFIRGYDQFYNPRRSDGRILVRLGPYNEDFKREEPGIENYIVHDAWTLVIPQLKDSDFFILFDENDHEVARYEVLEVIRNNLLFGNTGAQKFRAQRVRKTDPIYQVRAFRNTATMPMKITTSIGLLQGSNGTLIPHTHEIVVNENIVSISQINQTTSISAGHNHIIINGVMEMNELGHHHNIIL